MAAKKLSALTNTLLAMAIAILTGVGGKMTYDAYSSPVVAPLPVKEVSLLQESVAFTELKTEVSGDRRQLQKDWRDQKSKDDSQDTEIKSWRHAVEMLSESLVGIESKTEALQKQMTEHNQHLQGDITELQKDIKELLRRQKE